MSSIVLLLARSFRLDQSIYFDSGRENSTRIVFQETTELCHMLSEMLIRPGIWGITMSESLWMRGNGSCCITNCKHPFRYCIMAYQFNLSDIRSICSSIQVFQTFAIYLSHWAFPELEEDFSNIKFAPFRSQSINWYIVFLGSECTTWDSGEKFCRENPSSRCSPYPLFT